jgi:hypothetical protein
MVPQQFLPDDDGVHHREDAGAPVVVAFQRLEVGEQPGDVRGSIEHALRDVRREQRIDLTGVEHALSAFPSRRWHT